MQERQRGSKREGKGNPRGERNRERVGSKEMSICNNNKKKAVYQLGTKKSISPGQQCRQTCIRGEHVQYIRETGGLASGPAAGSI